MAETSHGNALTQTEILIEEAKALHGAEFDRLFDKAKGELSNEAPADLDLAAFRRAIDDLQPDERAALCLSGGGIRSATFGLGMLQSLARAGLLVRFHYLSTVSGGGYIGSWLSAWIARSGLDRVLSELTRHNDPEPDEIRRLRAYSNYLSPKRGLSTDLLALIGTVARNLVLHWLVVIPFLLVLVMVPWLVLELVRDASSWPASIAWCLVGSATLLLTWTIATTWASLPDPTKLKEPPTPVAPFAIALPVASLALALAGVHARRLDGLALAMIVVGLSIAVMALGISIGSLVLRERPTLKGMLSSVAAGLVGALLLAGMLAVLPDSSAHPVLYAAFGAPALLTVYWIATSMAAAISSRWAAQDALEWWARSGALTFRALLLWVGLTLVVLYGPLLLLQAGVRGVSGVIAVGGVSGLASALIGLWGRGGAEGRSEQGQRWYQSLQRLPLPVLASLFLILIIVTSSLAVAVCAHWSAFRSLGCVLTEQVVGGAVTPKGEPQAVAAGALNLDAAIGVAAVPHPESRWARLLLETASRYEAKALDGAPSLPQACDAPKETAVDGAKPGALALAIALLIGFLMATSRLVGVNRFSLHGMYGNRLVRAYLGASRPGDARANGSRSAFTGYDRWDDFPIWSLAPNPGPDLRPDLVPREQAALLPVVNAALNVTDSSHLDWQDRQAASFVVTPLRCGSATTGYLRSREYGGDGRAAAERASGISLGRAMTISGAAVSPGMGYHSSAPVAAVMTFFNTRLGCWLPNPGAAGQGVWHSDEPRSGLASILSEIGGAFSTRMPFVYLSDGGHFDNLGLYEMVRRRCRRIVVVDASQDPELAFDDLARSLRLIRVDLGIEIELETLPSVSVPGPTRPRFVCGRIRYSTVDPGARDGVILLLKPMLNGDEPIDVLRYGRLHADAKAAFPHESTTDQFFDETQFEGYRRLGVVTGQAASHMLQRLFEEPVAQLARSLAATPCGGMGASAAEIPPHPCTTATGVQPPGGFWSQLAGSGSSLLTPAIVSTIAAVTVTGTLYLARGEVTLTNPTLEIADRTLEIANPVQIADSTLRLADPTVHLDASSIALEQREPLELRWPPNGAPLPVGLDDTSQKLLRDLMSKPLKLELPGPNQALHIDPSDLDKIERLAAALRDVSLPGEELARIGKHVESVDSRMETLNSRVQSLGKTVTAIDPRAVVPGSTR